MRLRSAGSFSEFKTLFQIRKSGSLLPVVHGIAEARSSCSGQQPRKAQAELARLSRIMTTEELSASIAHEVKQPLAAIVSNGRWVPAMARPR
jgi:signal transduction histidine kinase